MKIPSELLTTFWARPVASFWIVTVAPGTAPPLLSLTVPEMTPSLCPNALTVRKHIAKTLHHNFALFILPPPRSRLARSNTQTDLLPLVAEALSVIREKTTRSFWNRQMSEAGQLRSPLG